MTTRSWIRNLFVRAVTRPGRKASHRGPPALEALEDRWVPSRLTGDGAAVHPARPLAGHHAAHPPAAAPPASGDPTIVVNNPTDTPVAGQTDLRLAIALANTNGGNETITFDSKAFKTARTINLDPALGELELSDTTGTEAIVGPKSGVTVNAGGNSRVFEVDANVTASISGLTITGGKTSGYGGGLYNNGTLTLTDCTVSGNSAFIGGGLGTSFSGGTTTLTDCAVSGNSATNVGGLFFYGPATLNNCTVSGNSGNFGGGVFTGGGATDTLG